MSKSESAAATASSSERSGGHKDQKLQESGKDIQGASLEGKHLPNIDVLAKDTNDHKSMLEANTTLSSGPGSKGSDLERSGDSHGGDRGQRHDQSARIVMGEDDE